MAGASFQWECILRAMDYCFELDRREGRPAASTLWLQADNTVKEVKNSISGRLMCCLVSSGFLREAGHHHLEVGHTHEDVGASNLSVAFCDMLLVC